MFNTQIYNNNLVIDYFNFEQLIKNQYIEYDKSNKKLKLLSQSQIKPINLIINIKEIEILDCSRGTSPPSSRRFHLLVHDVIYMN